MKALKKLLFQDNTGKYVIGQPPNVPVYLILAGVIGQSLARGAWHDGFQLLFYGAAFTWSYLEMRFGESGVRRVMGVLVMIGIVISWINK